MVQTLLNNLSGHPKGPNRNKIGISFDDHHSNITDLCQRGKYVHKVFEYKANGISNFLTLGIRSGMITGYKYCVVDANGKPLDSIKYGDQEGTVYVTDSKGAGEPPLYSLA